MRTAFAAFCSCVLLSLAAVFAPAQAGDYYDNGYYRDGYQRHHDGYYRHRHHRYGYRRSYERYGYDRPRARSVWYTSSCCYRRVVKHTAYYERKYRPHHAGYYGRPNRYGYYDRPYYRDRYYGGTYRYGAYRPAYYDSGRYYSGYRENGYDAYNTVSYGDTCASRRVPLADGRGGWVWGLKTNCY